MLNTNPAAIQPVSLSISGLFASFAEILSESIHFSDRIDRGRPQMVFHYTGNKVLWNLLLSDNIMGEKRARPISELYATSAAFLNDTSEFAHGKEVLNSIFENLRQGYFAGNLDMPSLEKNDRRDRIFKIVGDALSSLTDESRQQVFLISFSGQENHLGQWRAYGQNGAGVSLGLDLALLNSQWAGCGFWVAYDLADKSRIGSFILRRLIEFIDTTELIDGDEVVDNSLLESHELYLSVQRLLGFCCLVFKDESFSDELEYRIVWADFLNNIRDIVPCVFYKEDSLKPYVKLPGRFKDAQLPLKKITLGPSGPKGDLQRSLYTALDYLLSQGLLIYRPDVEVSSIPYRP